MEYLVALARCDLRPGVKWAQVAVKGKPFKPFKVIYARMACLVTSYKYTDF